MIAKAEEKHVFSTKLPDDIFLFDQQHRRVAGAVFYNLG